MMSWLSELKVSEVFCHNYVSVFGLVVQPLLSQVNMLKYGTYQDCYGLSHMKINI